MSLVTTSRICAILLVSAATAALPQQTEPVLSPTPPSPPALDLATASNDDQMPDPTKGLIGIDVVVTDNAGKPISGLSEKDFTLLDNGGHQKIVTFQAFEGTFAQRVTSLETVLVIDELNMVPKIKEGHGATANDPIHAARVKEELAFASAVRVVKTFLRANKGALENPTIVYRLTADGLFASPHPSMDGNELADEIEQPAKQDRIWPTSAITKDIEHITQGENVSARIIQSLAALGSIAIEERRKPGRKLMFWIGNGWQIENRKAAGLSDFSIELLTRMREARINLWGASEWPLYDSGGNAFSGARLDGKETAVGDYWPVQELLFKEFLEGPKRNTTDLRYLSLPVIAARSGGGMIDAPRDLAARIDERVKQEGTWYSLTFDPPRTNTIDEYHHLKIEIARPGLASHAFSDYYNQPVFYDQPLLTHPVTVKMLQAAISKPEDNLAQQIEGMELTERLSAAKLAEMEKQVRGKREREALRVLADESVFLAPPPDEILSTPPPELATQRQIISSAVSYIKTTLPKLPDFFATRTTVQYYEHPPNSDQTWKTASGDQSLYEGQIDKASIRIRNGKEEAQQESVKNTPDKPETAHLSTIGAFGPILAAVMVAATSPHSQLTWSRWEKGVDGPLAVFRYRATQATPLFYARFCCLAIDFASVPFGKNAPFHGEIAIDPSTGAILRLTIQADLEWRLPINRSDVMVEYAPVQRGARTFICPWRAVSISRQRRTSTIKEWGEGFKVYAPFETLLNEMHFEKYRIFGSTSRILPDFTEVPEKK